MVHQSQAFMLTHTGQVRKQNEDYVGMLREKNFFIISDGMGGHNAGEVASEIIVKTILEEFNQKSENLVDKSNIKNFFANSINRASQKVYELAQNKEDLKGMGGTVIVLYLHEQKYYTSWVGDSRLYLLHKKDFSQLTHDHSYVWQLFKSGSIRFEQMRRHPLRNIITRAVGNGYEVECDFKTGKYSKGDIFLLCSDGLNNELTDHEIKKVLLEYENAEESVKELISRANNLGGSDNISVIQVNTE